MGLGSGVPIPSVVLQRACGQQVASQFLRTPRLPQVEAATHAVALQADTGVCEQIICLMLALAMQSSGRNCNPAPDLVL